MEDPCRSGAATDTAGAANSRSRRSPAPEDRRFPGDLYADSAFFVSFFSAVFAGSDGLEESSPDSRLRDLRP
jgi:hypothetical protein